MRWLTEKTMRRLLWILLALALYFLGSAFYIPAKAMLAQRMLETAWTRTLETEQASKPWPWADTYPVARLRVPVHRVDLIVLDGDTGNSLAFGPGLHPASEVDKLNGLILISAHRDTHFNFLQHIQFGQFIELQTAKDSTTRYRVEELQIVDSRYGRIQAPEEGRWLTLVTCYPFDTVMANTTLRYVVMAEAISDCALNGSDCYI